MIDYRWSKLSPNFFGLHPSFLLFFPVWLASVSTSGGLGYVVFTVAILYIVYLLLAGRRQLGPLEYASYLWCRFVLGFEWRVREW